MRKLLPLVLALVGLGAGVGAGLALRPDPVAVVIDPCGNTADAAGHGNGADGHGTSGDAEGLKEYVKLNNQFIVPVVAAGKVDSLVILSISLEVTAGATDKVYTVEPKLRDTFLQVLFDHANSGGFDGAYTNANNMDVLRMALLETARQTLGDLVTDVLIVDIVRQEN